MESRTSFQRIVAIVLLSGILAFLGTWFGLRREATVTMGAAAISGENWQWQLRGDYRALQWQGELPAGMTWKDGRLWWQPTYQQVGTHSLHATLTRWPCTIRYALAVNVLPGNRPPILDWPFKLHAKEGEPWRQSLAIYDPDGDAVTCEVRDAPDGLTWHQDVDGLILSWTPGPDASGSHSLKVTVADHHTSRTKWVFLEVENVNQAPRIEPLGPVSIWMDEPFEVVLHASDPDGDDVAYAILNEPSTVSIDGDGVIRGKLGLGDARELVVQVTDEGGRAAQARIQFEFGKMTRMGLSGELPIHAVELDDEYFAVRTESRVYTCLGNDPTTILSAQPIRKPGNMTRLGTNLYTLGLQDLIVLDAADPNHLSVAYSLQVRDLMDGQLPWIVDDDLYLQAHGIKVFSLADPKAPRLVGTYPDLVYAAMYVRGGSLYGLSTKESRLDKLSLAPGTPPKVIQSWSLPELEFAKKVIVKGNRLVVDGPFAARVFTLAEREATEVGTIQSPLNAIAWRLVGEELWMVGSDEIAQASFDDPPAIINKVSRIDFDGLLTQQAVWRPDAQGRLTERPTLEDSTLAAGSRRSIGALNIVGDYLIAQARDGLRIYRLNGQEAPRLLERHDDTINTGTAVYQRFLVTGRELLEVGEDGKLTMLLKLPAMSTPVITGKRLYRIGGETLQIFDLSNPRNPRLLASHPSTGFVQTATASHNTLVRAVRNQRFVEACRLDDAGGLVERVRIAGLNGWITRLHLEGDRLYACEQTVGVSCWDISDLHRPRLIGRYLDQRVSDMVVAAGKVIVSSERQVKAVTFQSGTPIVLQAAPATLRASSMVLHGGYLYMTSRYGGIEILRMNLAGRMP